MKRFPRETLILLLTIIAGEIASFQQNEYVIKSERIEVAAYDKSFIISRTANFKYNRTIAAVNVTLDIKVDLLNVKVAIQGYRFASNEYRLFALTFEVDFRETLEKNDFGIKNLYSCGNFSGFPILKGLYRICNWTPDYAKFPPHVPSGKYRLDIKLMYLSKEIVKYQWYLEVEKIFRY